ncbi:MAG: thioredoxin [Endomicrobium sp.]|nr:thioredoxin [Endomicrobium sp.]
MIKEINEGNFLNEISLSNIPILIDFWAPWCGPCNMLHPIIEELDIEYNGKIKIVKINTEENASISSKFQITSIPCLILFKNNSIAMKIVGFRSKVDIKKSIDSILY